MRITTTTSHVLSAAAIIFGSAMCVQAAGTTPLTPTPAARQAAVAEPSEVKPLRSALELLRVADHDYQGHRVIAMRKIAEACRLLNDRPGRGGTGVQPPAAGAGRAGPGLAGAGRAGVGRAGAGPLAGQNVAAKEPEPQGASDAQLKQAQTIVQGVLSSIPAGTRPEVAALLNEAVTELNIALSIK